MTEHIQINDVQPRIHYVADGVQSAFSYPFAIFREADLEVWLDNAKQISGYTVSGAGITTGGTAIFTAPPGPGVGVTLRRRLALARTTDYQADGLIRAKTLNDELDFQVAAVQQVSEELGRAVKRSPTSASTADLTLPEPAPRRGLRWNDDGTALVNTANDPDAVGDATQAAADAIAARDIAVASAGGVRVSANDSLAGPLAVKLVAGEGITLTECADGDDERLTVASILSASVLDRLAFLETNLAVNTLRDQIDAGWSVLKMVDGWADEFEDETGVDTTASVNESHDPASGSYMPVAASYGGDLTGGQTVTASSVYGTGYAIAALVDDSPATAWGSDSADTQWVQVQFATPRRIGRLAMRAVTDGDYTRAPSAFTLKASSTGAFAGEEVTLLTVTGATWSQGEIKTWSFGNDRSFTHHRITMTNKQDSFGRAAEYIIAELEMMEAVAADLALVSKAVLSAAALPAEARLVLLHQSLDPVVVNTDLIAEASRDGGTTWSAVTLEAEGVFDAATAILSGTADLSAQPTGTAMRW